jgi:hypothetical protein
MSGPYREIDFTDELLVDGSVHRRFADGREEWRRRGDDGRVRWRDRFGATGTDEQLGQRIVKRQASNGQVVYGRDLGYGRTVWGNGTITRNRTSFGGRVGAILAAIGAGTVLGTVLAPPVALSFVEEEQLRQQARAAQNQSSGGDSGSGGADTASGSADWDDGGGADSDDFG